MGYAVRTHQTGAVDEEGHRQSADAHIRGNLVKGALQERGIDRYIGLHALSLIHIFLTYAGVAS